ncbi:MAG: hypothetical protein PVG63_06935 [Anaerolineales bacterium]
MLNVVPILRPIRVVPILAALISLTLSSCNLPALITQSPALPFSTEDPSASQPTTKPARVTPSTMPDGPATLEIIPAETAEAISAPEILLPTSTITNTPRPIVLAPTHTFQPGPLATFRLAVIIDLSSEAVTYEEALAVIQEADDIFHRLTSLHLEMIDFVEMTPLVDENRDQLADRYLASGLTQAPNGIVVFSFGHGDAAKLYGGYSYTAHLPAGFRNPFVIAGDDTIVSISMVHYSHHYATCGYDLENRENLVSSVSIDGECFNVPGTPCVTRYGYSMCSTAVDDLYASTATYFTASSIIHEIAHPYGDYGVDDHYGTTQCQENMGWDTPGDDIDEAQSYNGMCPYVYDNIRESYAP